MSSDQPHVTLDDREGWARLRAVVVCLVGIGVIALSAAMLALVVLAAVARFWTWLLRRDIESSGIWGIATETAVGAGVIAVVISFVIFFWWFWTGAVDVVLREVRAERVDEPSGEGQRRTMNLLEELSIGLGRPIPELWVTKDETPNTLSLRMRRSSSAGSSSCASVIGLRRKVATSITLPCPKSTWASRNLRPMMRQFRKSWRTSSGRASVAMSKSLGF